MNSRLVLIIAFLLIPFAAQAAFADVAPPPGFTAVGNTLVLKSSGDLNGYRFFLRDLSGAFEEVSLDPSSPTSIGGDERRGPARWATLWAVPENILPAGNVGPEDLSFLSSQPGGPGQKDAIKLLDHDFQKPVNVIDSADTYRESYEISIDPATRRPVADRIGEESGPTLGFSLTPMILGAAGIVLFAAIVIIGLLVIRRFRKNRTA